MVSMPGGTRSCPRTSRSMHLTDGYGSDPSHMKAMLGSRPVQSRITRSPIYASMYVSGLTPKPQCARYLTNVAADKRSSDCAWLRRALLFDSLAAELGR